MENHPDGHHEQTTLQLASLGLLLARVGHHERIAEEPLLHSSFAGVDAPHRPSRPEVERPDHDQPDPHDAEQRLEQANHVTRSHG